MSRNTCSPKQGRRKLILVVKNRGVKTEGWDLEELSSLGKSNRE